MSTLQHFGRGCGEARKVFEILSFVYTSGRTGTLGVPWSGTSLPGEHYSSGFPGQCGKFPIGISAMVLRLLDLFGPSTARLTQLQVRLFRVFRLLLGLR